MPEERPKELPVYIDRIEMPALRKALRSDSLHLLGTQNGRIITSNLNSLNSYGDISRRLSNDLRQYVCLGRGQPISQNNQGALNSSRTFLSSGFPLNDRIPDTNTQLRYLSLSNPTSLSPSLSSIPSSSRNSSSLFLYPEGSRTSGRSAFPSALRTDTPSSPSNSVSFSSASPLSLSSSSGFTEMVSQDLQTVQSLKKRAKAGLQAKTLTDFFSTISSQSQPSSSGSLVFSAPLTTTGLQWSTFSKVVDSREGQSTKSISALRPTYLHHLKRSRNFAELDDQLSQSSASNNTTFSGISPFLALSSSQAASSSGLSSVSKRRCLEDLHSQLCFTQKSLNVYDDEELEADDDEEDDFEDDDEEVADLDAQVSHSQIPNPDRHNQHRVPNPLKSVNGSLVPQRILVEEEGDIDTTDSSLLSSSSSSLSLAVSVSHLPSKSSTSSNSPKLSSSLSSISESTLGEESSKSSVATSSQSLSSRPQFSVVQGQKRRLPSSLSMVSTSESASSASENSYLTQRGSLLSQLIDKNRTALEQLKEANNLPSSSDLSGHRGRPRRGGAGGQGLRGGIGRRGGVVVGRRQGFLINLEDEDDNRSIDEAGQNLQDSLDSDNSLYDDLEDEDVDSYESLEYDEDETDEQRDDQREDDGALGQKQKIEGDDYEDRRTSFRDGLSSIQTLDQIRSNNMISLNNLLNDCNSNNNNGSHIRNTDEDDLGQDPYDVEDNDSLGLFEEDEDEDDDDDDDDLDEGSDNDFGEDEFRFLQGLPSSGSSTRIHDEFRSDDDDDDAELNEFSD